MSAAQPAAPAADLPARLGSTLLDLLAIKHGRPAAEAWASSLVIPTLPGTPARQQQDAAWTTLTRRLIAASGDEGGE